MIEDRKGSLPRKERTTNVYLVGIRKFLFFCDISDIEAINYKKILICREERKEKTYIKREQVDRYLDIIQNLDGNFLSKIRDLLIIKALWLTGLRVSELLSIRYDDIKSDGSVVIMGKGRKERRIFFNEELQKQSNFYKRTREESNLVSDYIFVSHANNSRGKKLSRNSVEVLIRNTNKKLGVEEKITPHSFRHGFATYVVRRGGNLVDLQHTLGHSNISITSMYLHSEASRVKALQKLVE